MDKLGPHTQQITPKGKLWASRANIVKAIDDPGSLYVAKPSAIKIFRKYFPSYSVWTHGRDLVKEALAALGDAPCDYIQVQNENSQFLEQGLERLVWQTREAKEYLIKVRPDLKLLGFGFSTGCPEKKEWEYLRQEKYGNADAIGLNQYWGNQGFTIWNALRHRLVHEWTEGDQPPIIITECGRDDV